MMRPAPNDEPFASPILTIYLARLLRQDHVSAGETSLVHSRITTMHSHAPVLSADLLRRCGERSAGYDRDNHFFDEDFAELKDAGYLTLAVPKELGGPGLTLSQVCAEQRRLAYHAPATALAINMHNYWIGTASSLWRNGDTSLEWLLKEALAGEVFNGSHSERGSEGVRTSTSKAARVEGGFRITGHKLFNSLSPVTTRFGGHATWADAEGGPKIVHFFMPRETAGWRIVKTWDTLGMRATSSDDLMLEDAFIPDCYVGRILPVGGGDLFLLSIYAWCLLGFAFIYHGIAQRAIDLVLPSIKKKTSLSLTRSMAYHPEIQHLVADMILAFDPIGPHIEKIADDWTASVPHGAAWPAKILSAKYHAVEACWKIADMAMELSGGGGMFKGNELERLFRDARCGRFHPANSFVTHEVVAKAALRIDATEQPRWG